MQNEVILSVRDLAVSFHDDDDCREVLHGVNFDLKAGRTLGIVGESGSGKSVTAMSIMGLLPKPYGVVTKGRISYRDTDLLKLEPSQMYSMRGDRISIIFQDPMTALNPVQTVGKQLNEVLELHRPELSKSERKATCLDMLKRVRIPCPRQD